MASRGQSLTVSYYAFNATTGAAVTGDVANHTLRWVKDGTSAAPTNAASEVDATNCKGLYKITLTSTETTADFGVLCVQSSTASVIIQPVQIAFENLPTAAPGASGGLPLSVDSSGRVDVLKINGTPQTARDIGASVLLSPGTGTGQIALSSGAVTVGANNDKTGYGLSASQTFNLTGNITGNLTGSVGSVTSAVTLPSIPTNWVTSAGIAAGALNGKGDWSTLAEGAAMTLTAAYDAAKTAASQSSVDLIPTNPLTSLGTNAPVGWLNAASIAVGALSGKGDWSTLTQPDIRSAIGLASANLDTQLSGLPAAIWAHTTRTLSSFGTLVSDIWANVARTLTDKTGFAPSAADNANAVRSDLNSDLTTLLTNTSAIKTITDRLNTMLEQNGVVYRFTSDGLHYAISAGTAPTAAENALAVQTILDPSFTSIQNSLDTLTAAGDPWSLTEAELDAYPADTAARGVSRLLKVPGDPPILVIPDPSTADDECVVYLYDEQGDGKQLKGRSVTFTLSGHPTKIGDIVVDTNAITLKTNSVGLLTGSLKRTDLMLPAGRKWVVTSDNLGFDGVELELTTAGPINLKTLVPNV